MTAEFKNVKISLNFFFAVVITLMLIYDKSNLIVLNLCAVIMHETGHLLCMLLMGEKPKEIKFTPFGLCIERAPVSRLSYNQEIWVAFAGPLINILLFAVFLMIYLFSGNEAIVICSVINIVIALFNLLPCEPLDGSKMLQNYLLKRHDEREVKKLLKYVSAIAIFPVAVAGFVILVRSGYNISLLLVSIYLIAFLIFKK
ncbi:hypothetical protein SDC9_119651 [bioreactor metagenome]|uniref:Peptidase M50 domain-containing protein n=1 Tax=bioreactor metagenome TaxID=1076179 RepID=A0A645C542_9ZZZZ